MEEERESGWAVIFPDDQSIEASRYALAHNYMRFVARSKENGRKRELCEREDVKSLKRLKSGRSHNRKTVFGCNGNDRSQRHFKSNGESKSQQQHKSDRFSSSYKQGHTVSVHT